jgi:hypothetical protein
VLSTIAGGLINERDEDEGDGEDEVTEVNQEDEDEELVPLDSNGNPLPPAPRGSHLFAMQHRAPTLAETAEAATARVNSYLTEWKSREFSLTPQRLESQIHAVEMNDYGSDKAELRTPPSGITRVLQLNEDIALEWTELEQLFGRVLVSNQPIDCALDILAEKARASGRSVFCTHTIVAQKLLQVQNRQAL